MKRINKYSQFTAEEIANLKRLIPKLISLMCTGNYSGLCSCVKSGISRVKHRLLLYRFIELARPKWYQLRYYNTSGGVFWFGKSFFYWKPNSIKPRVKWLNKRLKELNKL